MYGERCGSEDASEKGIARAMDSSSLNILLVEDDETLAEMYRLKLVAEGYEVRVASDGPSGLAAALRRPPDLLLLDIRLPGFDGLELLDQLRRSPAGSSLPVFVFSNYGEMEMVERGRALGVAQHLIKSQTTPGTLVETIKRHLPEGPPAPTPA